MDKKYYKVIDIIDECVVKLSTFLSYINKGYITSAVKMNRSWYIDEKDYDAIPKKGEYIKISDYANMHNVKSNTILIYAMSNKLKTAYHYYGMWYVSPSEPFPDSLKEEEIPKNYITLKEYAKLHKISLGALQSAIRNGKYKTARKIKRGQYHYYYIDKNEKCVTFRSPSANTGTVDTPPEGYISTSEASKKYNIEQYTLRTFIKQNLVHSVKTVRNRWYLRESDLKNVSIFGMESIAEYARKHNLSPYDVLRAYESKKINKLIKFNGRWYIDPNEEFEMDT